VPLAAWPTSSSVLVELAVVGVDRTDAVEQAGLAQGAVRVVIAFLFDRHRADAHVLRHFIAAAVNADDGGPQVAAVVGHAEGEEVLGAGDLAR